MNKQLIKVTATGEQHGLINTITNAVAKSDYAHMDPKTKAEVEKQAKEDAKIVKVEYINRTGKHERLEKPYCRYAGEPIQQWRFIPGHVYEVPLGLVKEVNQARMPKRSGLVEVDGQKVNSDGSPLAQDQEGEWVHKMIPVSF